MATKNAVGNSLTGATGTGAFAGATSPALVNPTANNFINGQSITATAAGTTTLTVASNQTQVFTGTTTQTVVLPVVSTLVLGTPYIITNLSSGIVTVQSSGANTIQAMQANSTLVVVSNATTGTAATVWYVLQYTAAASGQSGTGNLVRATGPTFSAPVLGAASATSMTFSSTTGIIGTATNDSAAAGSVGEILSASGSGVTLTSGATANGTSLSLTAGDWVAYGVGIFSNGGTGAATSIAVGINTTSVTLPASGEYTQLPVATTAGFNVRLNAAPRSIKVASTTTLYLVLNLTYTNTYTGGGTLFAVRIR